MLIQAGASVDEQDARPGTGHRLVPAQHAGQRGVLNGLALGDHPWFEQVEAIFRTTLMTLADPGLRAGKSPAFYVHRLIFMLVARASM
jgi:hypothetical protein